MSSNNYNDYKFIFLVSVLINYLILLVDFSDQHGRLFEPPARNTMWRFGYKSTANYNDNELFCGGIGAIVRNEGKCGVCGDPYDGVRFHETGHIMAPNKTVRNYFPGSSIDLVIDIVANHGGTFEFEMCWRDSWSKHETEDCFEPLQMITSGSSIKSQGPDANGDSDGVSSRLLVVDTTPLADDNALAADSSSDYYELDPSAGTGSFAMSVQLPFNRTCEFCIFRWHWRTANNWGQCDDGSERVGCGYQEIYRNCADVSVKRDGSGIGLSR